MERSSKVYQYWHLFSRNDLSQISKICSKIHPKSVISNKYLKLSLRYYKRSILYMADFDPWLTTFALSRYTPPLFILQFLLSCASSIFYFILSYYFIIIIFFLLFYHFYFYFVFVFVYVWPYILALLFRSLSKPANLTWTCNFLL